MSYLSDQLRGVLSIDPNAQAIEYEKEWVSWGQLKAQVDRIGSLLDGLDLGADARIGIMIQNTPDSIAGILAAILRNACIVSINPLLPPERLNADLTGLKLPVVVASRQDFAREGVVDLLRESGTAGIVLDPVLQNAATHSGLPTTLGEGLVMSQPDTFIEMLTSGTTGTPKRIPLKRKSLVASMTAALNMEKGRNPDDPPILRSGTELLGNPITHIGGLYFVVTTILSGRKMCLQDRFTVAGWHDAVKRHRPKIVGGVPAALKMLLEADIPKEDIDSLVAIRSGTAPLDPEIVDEFLERYDIPVVGSYGATEFAGAVSMWRLKEFREMWPKKRGSVGTLFPGVKGRIVDPTTGDEVASGEEGVLELMAGQIGDGKTWVRTTDRAVLDEDGYLFIRGRADNAIIRGGFKVHPDDVVKILHQHPAIREAVVVGVPDTRLGEVPAAVIMLRDGAEQPGIEELRAFVKDRALPYQVPVKYLFVEDVPRTTSMKPALPQVKAMFNDMA